MRSEPKSLGDGRGICQQGGRRVQPTLAVDLSLANERNRPFLPGGTLIVYILFTFRLHAFLPVAPMDNLRVSDCDPRLPKLALFMGYH